MVANVRGGLPGAAATVLAVPGASVKFYSTPFENHMEGDDLGLAHKERDREWGGIELNREEHPRRIWRTAAAGIEIPEPSRD